MKQNSISRTIALIAVTAALACPIALSPLGIDRAVAAQPASKPLGDLADYRALAENTLIIVNSGDIPAARIRVRDLETAWDKATPALKAKNRKAWTVVDTAIDDALIELRTPNPVKDDCSAALEKLLATFDAYSK